MQALDFVLTDIYLNLPPLVDSLATYGYQADGSPADDGPAHWVLIYDKQGPQHLYCNRCPHTGAPMEWQAHTFLDFDGKHILCALHGARFAPSSGHCLGGPCNGRGLEKVSFEHTAKGLLVQV